MERSIRVLKRLRARLNGPSARERTWPYLAAKRSATACLILALTKSRSVGWGSFIRRGYTDHSAGATDYRTSGERTLVVTPPPLPLPKEVLLIPVLRL
jgi:hypothetical protein